MDWGEETRVVGRRREKHGELMICSEYNNDENENGNEWIRPMEISR